MLNIGPFEIVLILAIALVVIGPDGLPEAARKVARFFGELRRYGEEVQSEVRAIIDDAVAAAEEEKEQSAPDRGTSSE